MSAADPWADAQQAAALLAIDPRGLGGASLRAAPGPVRDRWLGHLRALLPAEAPFRKLPLHAGDGRVLGGLDLAATLRAGRPVAERGVLSEADGGVVLLAMAERLSPGMAARLAAVLDAGEVVIERDGLALRHPARVALVALDEGEEEEAPPASLLERLAFRLPLDGVGWRDAVEEPAEPSRVAAARGRLPSIGLDDEVLSGLCAAARALGVSSLRASLLAWRAARAAAALAGREVVGIEDAALAARLVLAPRATRLPAESAPAEPPPKRPQDEAVDQRGDALPEEVVLAAARAAIPPGLLARLELGPGDRRDGPGGRAGAARASLARGRPAGVRKGEPRAGARLDLVETLRAAAPWQPLRRRQRGPGRSTRVEVRADDFRVTRRRQRTRSTTIFVVDASGSSAFRRLAEAKSAVELLLADCYIRRDRVALLAFRGQGTELLLPPTRSLARAKRGLASLPGGGPTPLASAIDAALALGEAVRRQGESPLVVLLTDGGANVTRDGATGRAAAEAEALATAKRVRAAALPSLLVDTSPRPAERARRLAAALGASYVALPYADATALSRVVQATARAAAP